jgi:hypothetical protein
VSLALGRIPLKAIRTKDLEALLAEAKDGAASCSTRASAARGRGIERRAAQLFALLADRDDKPANVGSRVVVHVDFRPEHRPPRRRAPAGHR